jgi:PhnB protein
MAPNPIPDDYPQVTPYLCVDGAAAAIEFYTAVFGAEVRMQIPAPDDKIGHCELQIGSGLIMVSDEYAEMDVRGPVSIGGTPVTISLYVEDVDSVVAAALAAGATLNREIEDQFYGDRSGQITDPWGHRWNVASHIEDVAPAEMMRRSEALFG